LRVVAVARREAYEGKGAEPRLTNVAGSPSGRFWSHGGRPYLLQPIGLLEEGQNASRDVVLVVDKR